MDEGDGKREEEAGVGGGGQKGCASSSGYVWKKRGAKVEPKNAPARESRCDIGWRHAELTIDTLVL